MGDAERRKGVGFWSLFGKRGGKETPAPAAEQRTEAEPEVYSGMRVEVTALDGRILFVAKIRDLQGSTAVLHQYSETALSPDRKSVV